MKESEMKKFSTIFLMTVFLSGITMAAEKPAIGYVDMRQVMLESKIGKKNRTIIEKFVEDKKAGVAREEAKLKALQESFQKDQLLMSDAQKKDKQKEFEGKVEAYQKMVAEAKQDINQKDTEFTNKTVTEVKDIIRDIAKEMKISLVMEASEMGLLYADEGMDLTAKVMQKYDAKAK
jgi:outer membrane protein